MKKRDGFEGEDQEYELMKMIAFQEGYEYFTSSAESVCYDPNEENTNEFARHSVVTTTVLDSTKEIHTRPIQTAEVELEDSEENSLVVVEDSQDTIRPDDKAFETELELLDEMKSNPKKGKEKRFPRRRTVVLEAMKQLPQDQLGMPQNGKNGPEIKIQAVQSLGAGERLEKDDTDRDENDGEMIILAVQKTEDMNASSDTRGTVGTDVREVTERTNKVAEQMPPKSEKNFEAKDFAQVNLWKNGEKAKREDCDRSKESIRSGEETELYDTAEEYLSQDSCEE